MTQHFYSEIHTCKELKPGTHTNTKTEKPSLRQLRHTQPRLSCPLFLLLTVSMRLLYVAVQIGSCFFLVGAGCHCQYGTAYEFYVEGYLDAF